MTFNIDKFNQPADDPTQPLRKATIFTVSGGIHLYTDVTTIKSIPEVYVLQLQTASGKQVLYNWEQVMKVEIEEE